MMMVCRSVKWRRLTTNTVLPCYAILERRFYRGELVIDPTAGSIWVTIIVMVNGWMVQLFRGNPPQSVARHMGSRQWRRFLLDSGGDDMAKSGNCWGDACICVPPTKIFGGGTRPPYNRRPWITQCYLPPDKGERALLIISAIGQAGTRFTYARGMEGWVSWLWCWLYT